MKNDLSPLVIGVDYGSDSVRSILVETETGKILGSAVHEYRRWNEGKYSDASEQRFRQHPLDYLEGLENTIRGVLRYGDPARVAGIGVDTTGSTPCAVDRNGTPLALLPGFEEDPDAMFLLWKDHTGLKESDEINAYLHTKSPVDYSKYVGGVYSSEWFYSKVLHILRHSRKVRENACTFVEHGDWIVGLLTGNTSPDTLLRNRCAAGHKALWNAEWGGLPGEAFFREIDPLLMPCRDRLCQKTVTAGSSAGRLSPEWAAKLGLSERVAVSVTGFDAHFGAVGAGIEEEGMVSVFGTSKVDLVLSRKVKGCIRGICGQVDGSIIPGFTGLEAGQAAFGDAYAWFRKFLNSTGSPVTLPELEKQALALSPDPEGVLVLDWFNGRRTPDANEHLKGCILGLDLGTTPAQVYRAIVEATACGMRAIFERFREEGVEIRSIKAVGGIAKKSPFVMQTCADVLNKSISIAESDQVCALGSAIAAACAAGLYPDMLTAGKVMASPVSGVYTPDPDRHRLYQRLYERYRRYGKILEEEQNR